MPAIAPRNTIDPLKALIAGAINSGTRRTIPLVSTSFDVRIEAGLAVVATQRVFRNEEPNSIEAMITFPVPVHAILFALEARIDGRVMKARAQRRILARETYEDALERGKAAILHEEILRGVHMLSVGHIAPGAQVEVSTQWATTLTITGDRSCLRIPLTMGEIYGRSRLPDSDDLIYGGTVQTAELTVRCSDGAVELVGGSFDDGRAKVMLNAPIDLMVTGWKPRDLRGRAADGRDVFLRVEPQPVGEVPLNVAIVIDHSGSMGEICSGGAPSITKHWTVISGLKSIAERLDNRDFVDLWEFDDSPTHVGSTEPTSDGSLLGAAAPRGPGQKLMEMIHRLNGPAGGTEIGTALATVAAQSAARDVMLVTDGKSYALDVQALAQTGRRFTVVLVGEDSLEANVGHLAALTSGDIFVASGTDLHETMVAAFQSLRQPNEAPVRITGDLRQLKAGRGNALISVEWRTSTLQAGDAFLARAVAAVSTSLALPALDAEAAGALAETEGLVTHLTSLVLVDEEAEVQEGVPATRKIALPTPRTASMRMPVFMPSVHHMQGM